MVPRERQAGGCGPVQKKVEKGSSHPGPLGGREGAEGDYAQKRGVNRDQLHLTRARSFRERASKGGGAGKHPT